MIYFIRHGESEANLKGIFAGQKDHSALTEKGRQQAGLEAEKIQQMHITPDVIITSPMKRALETAEIIAQKINFISPLIQDTRIAEYDMGSLTGTPIKNISSKLLVSATEAEHPDDFHERIFSFLNEYSKSPEDIIVVSHAGVGRMIESIRLNLDSKLFYDLPSYPNATVIPLDWLENFPF